MKDVDGAFEASVKGIAQARGIIDSLDGELKLILTADDIEETYAEGKRGLILDFQDTLSFVTTSLTAHDLEGAVSSEDRTPKNMLRDSARNPVETLSFFVIKSDMVVVELSPGGLCIQFCFPCYGYN